MATKGQQPYLCVYVFESRCILALPIMSLCESLLPVPDLYRQSPNGPPSILPLCLNVPVSLLAVQLKRERKNGCLFSPLFSTERDPSSFSQFSLLYPYTFDQFTIFDSANEGFNKYEYASVLLEKFHLWLWPNQNVITMPSRNVHYFRMLHLSMAPQSNEMANNDNREAI